jgi:hypothetical protein
LGFNPAEFERESVLVNFPANFLPPTQGSMESGTPTKNNNLKPKYAQNIMVSPVWVTDKPIAYLVIGQLSPEPPFG